MAVEDRVDLDGVADPIARAVDLQLFVRRDRPGADADVAGLIALCVEDQ